MKNSVYNSQTLRKLDMTLYGGSPATIGTQFGDITVRKSQSAGYCAELMVEGEEFPSSWTYGLTPAIAFLALGESLKDEEQKAKAAATVVPFPQAA